jgi:hypothetical protein
VEFYLDSDVQAWKNMFPHPATSPAHYARSLSVFFIEDVTATDVGREVGYVEMHVQCERTVDFFPSAISYRLSDSSP